ncbi:MAG TPA: VWA domain-containing protein [Verrucomicrobiae bacterium]|jgi:Ca-activated chloride channel family protein|nr:VWA domain-containing protein [Verrucomicrobiae bacterium]
MTFDHPARAGLALLVAAALNAALTWLARRKRASELTYSNLAFLNQATDSGRWVHTALLASWCVGALLLATAIGGPRVTLPTLVRDGSVVLCIDTSGSMASTDVAPTRIQAAIGAARAFVRATAGGSRIGIIAFSTQAAVAQPLTADRAALDAALDAFPAPNGATAIGDALALAAQNLPPKGHRVVVLITDGVNNRGTDPMAAAQALGAQHIPVYTVGIGTNSGDIIPGTSEEASIDEDALRAYAQVSGGQYARADSADTLRSVLSQLGRVTSFEWKKVDAGLDVAIGGGVVMLAAFVAGFALGRFP